MDEITITVDGVKLADYITKVETELAQLRSNLRDAVELWGKCLFPDMPHHSERYQDFLDRPSIKAVMEGKG